MQLDQYIADRCHTYPTGRAKLVTFTEAFRATLTPRERKLWSRKRVISELRGRGFLVAKAGDRCTWIAGVSLDPAPRYTVEGGKLVLA